MSIVLSCLVAVSHEMRQNFVRRFPFKDLIVTKRMNPLNFVTAFCAKISPKNLGRANKAINCGLMVTINSWNNRGGKALIDRWAVDH